MASTESLPHVGYRAGWSPRTCSLTSQTGETTKAYTQKCVLGCSAGERAMSVSLQRPREVWSPDTPFPFQRGEMTGPEVWHLAHAHRVRGRLKARPLSRQPRTPWNPIRGRQPFSSCSNTVGGEVPTRLELLFLLFARSSFSKSKAKHMPQVLEGSLECE